MNLDFTIDIRQLQSGLDRLEKKVLPTAQAGFLNGLAFGARKHLAAYAEKTIQGKPTGWTKRGFVVDKAQPGKMPAATVRIQQQQSQYMTYLINGGTRRAGDAGASSFDVRVGGAAEGTNTYGNMKRNYLKQVARKAKSEKTKRARLAKKRETLRKKGLPTTPARWMNNNPTLSPGIFFGKIGGRRGYWERARFSGGDYKIKLLVAFSDAAKYRPSFLWDAEIGKSIRIQNTAKLFDAELTRALRAVL